MTGLSQEAFDEIYGLISEILKPYGLTDKVAILEAVKHGVLFQHNYLRAHKYI